MRSCLYLYTYVAFGTHPYPCRGYRSFRPGDEVLHADSPPPTLPFSLPSFPVAVHHQFYVLAHDWRKFEPKGSLYIVTVVLSCARRDVGDHCWAHAGPQGSPLDYVC